MILYRINPHANAVRENGGILFRVCGMNLDGRKRDALLPAGDLRWLQTGFLFANPAPPTWFKTSPELSARKLLAVDWRNDDELLIAIMSLRQDSVYLPHNTPIAQMLFVSIQDDPQIELLEAPGGLKGNNKWSAPSKPQSSQTSGELSAQTQATSSSTAT